MAITDKHFFDWHEHVLGGFGYGTGEPHTIGALKTFFSLLGEDGRYDYRDSESAIGPIATWLLISALYRNSSIFEYGSSSRFGWLTPTGQILADYLKPRSVDDILETFAALSSANDGFSAAPCTPNECHCEQHCRNPLFLYGSPA